MSLKALILNAAVPSSRDRGRPKTPAIGAPVQDNTARCQGSAKRIRPTI
jgi:hypothetical protein